MTSRRQGAAVPLFSPTQVPSREHVLRSIWSSSPIMATAESSAMATPRRMRMVDTYNHNTKHTDVSHSMDQFYSPLAGVGASPISVISDGTSFRSSMPVDMFSFDYVSTCQSEHELNQIVETLQHDNPGSYPSLLRTARRQLEAVTAERKTVSWAQQKSSMHNYHHSSMPMPSTTTSPSQDHSSLAMSISTTMLDDSLQVSPTPKPRRNNNSTTTTTTASTRLFNLAEEPFAEELDQVQEERCQLEQQLTHQVQQLQKRLDNNRDVKDQHQLSLTRKIQDLEIARATAEEKVIRLEKALETSNSKHQSMLKSIEHTAQQDATELRRQLEIEQKQSRDSIQAARQTEQRLRHELEHIRGNSKSAEQAEASLEHSKAQLSAIRDEQVNLLMVLQRAIGHDTASVAAMDAKERHDLVRNVSLKLASSKAAVKAFAQAMASAENDRSTLKDAHRLAQTRIKELKTLNERLKRENELLMKQNASLNDRVEDIQTQASTQMQTLEARQKEYQETITLLKKQVRSSETSVSMALYQRTATESRMAQKQLEEKNDRIDQLEKKLDLVQQMGRQMKEQYERSMKERERVLEDHLQKESLHQHQNQEQTVRASNQDEIHRRQHYGKERRLQETERVRALLEMAPLATDTDIVKITPNPPVGKSSGKTLSKRKNSPATAVKTTTPPIHRPPPPPPPRVSPDGSTPSPHHGTKRLDPPASRSPFTPPLPPPPPRPVVSSVQGGAPPSRSQGLSDNGLPKLQKFPISIFADEVPPPPPPKRSSPIASPSPKVTQRAYKRLNAITAAGGRNSIREKLNTIRRSPLGNATNTTRGVAF